ncbi:retrotransposon protein, putative, ty1-copia subclass [Tanacetum coccineum]
MQSMKDNEVWDLVDLPPNGKTVGSKWLFKKKTDMDGAVHTYKARLVAKGYTQTPGIDYEETFSPIADIRAIRILIAITSFYDYEIWKMDVKNACINAYLSEEVLHGASERKFGFTQNRDEPCVYLKASGSNVTFLILYVDDILIMGNNIPMLQDVKSYLGRCFAMKDLGEAAYILRIKIYRDRSRRLIGLKRMQNVPYALAVGSIMYAVRCTRPDVVFAQNITSRFQQNPGDVDWKSAKQSIFATSSVEAEYIAAFDASKEAVWVRKFISGLGVVPIIEKPINMYCDNIGAIAIANESGITKGARHFRAKVHYLGDVIEFGDIKLEKVHTDDNLADLFTKALAFPKHSELTRSIGMLPGSSLM